MRQGDE